jgi:hypothetical protein
MVKKTSECVKKAMPHTCLKILRPGFISIKSIVRDAVARLPDGVGTRDDVACLMQDS